MAVQMLVEAFLLCLCLVLPLLLPPSPDLLAYFLPTCAIGPFCLLTRYSQAILHRFTPSAETCATSDSRFLLVRAPVPVPGPRAGQTRIN